MDVASLASNVADGNWAGAAVDAGGLIVDAAATVVPGVPGGAGTAIKAVRGANKTYEAGKAFTKAQKRDILAANRAKNNGVLRSDLSGKELVKAQQHQKGVSPPRNEAHVDHIKAKSKGGTNSPSNAQVLSREENLSKSNK
jgi:hypothetical protein